MSEGLEGREGSRAASSTTEASWSFRCVASRRSSAEARIDACEVGTSEPRHCNILVGPHHGATQHSMLQQSAACVSRCRCARACAFAAGSATELALPSAAQTRAPRHRMTVADPLCSPRTFAAPVPRIRPSMVRSRTAAPSGVATSSAGCNGAAYRERVRLLHLLRTPANRRLQRRLPPAERRPVLHLRVRPPHLPARPPARA